MFIETNRAIKLFFPNSSLVQVFFEAVVNAFDAGADEVAIHIEIDSISDQDSLQITITDNGTGFTEESFGRFIELLNARDELHHGTGRLIYLNYFDYVEIDSIFAGNRRTFTFDKDFKDASQLSELEEPKEQETKLTFRSYRKAKVGKADYLKPGALKEEIIRHFLPTLYRRKRKGEDFTIKLSLETKEDDINKGFLSTDETITPDDLPDLTDVPIQDPTLDALDDITMSYQIQSGVGVPSLVTAADIDGRTIPLNLVKASTLPIGHSAIFLFSSKTFHGNSDHPRQKIALPEDVSEADLYRVLRRELGKVLNEHIPRIKEENIKTEKKFEDSFPHLLGYIDKESVGLIDTEEALETAQRRMFKEQKSILLADELDDEDYEKSLELSSRTLTEYILYRDKIIRRMREMTKENTEAEIHNLIVPRYETHLQEDLVPEIYRNNAWLLDDKFMTFQTILSEGTMTQVIQSITLEDESPEVSGRPDISMIFSGDPEGDQSVDVVIVEIKKKTDSIKENQYAVSQLTDRAIKLVKHCPNIQQMWYYAVIQLDDELATHLRANDWASLFSKGQLYHKTLKIERPDGSIVPTPTFVMSFDAIVADAECRNHTFLEILRSDIKKQLNSEEQLNDSPATT